jgi:hypothetical protein
MTNRNRLRLLSAFPLLVALAGCESTEPAPSATTTSAASAKGAASAAATAAASATGAASAEVEAAPATLPPDKDTVKGEPVEYEAGGVKLKGYLAYDTAQKDKRPGVLVVHEWWGRNDYAEKRARLVAGLGYTALAVDMYGDGKTADTPDDAKKLSGEVFGDMATAKARFEAAHKLLAEQETTDPDKIAAIGYCFGGGIVLHMARAGVDLDGVASFHGSLGTDKPADQGQAPRDVRRRRPDGPRRPGRGVQEGDGGRWRRPQIHWLPRGDARVHQPGRDRGRQEVQAPGRLRQGRRPEVVEGARGLLVHDLRRRLSATASAG